MVDSVIDTINIDGARLAEILGDLDEMPYEYVLLFNEPGNEHVWSTILDLLDDVSDWDKTRLRRLKMREVMALFERVVESVGKKAVTDEEKKS